MHEGHEIRPPATRSAKQTLLLVDHYSRFGIFVGTRDGTMRQEDQMKENHTHATKNTHRGSCTRYYRQVFFKSISPFVC